LIPAIAVYADIIKPRLKSKQAGIQKTGWSSVTKLVCFYRIQSPQDNKLLGGYSIKTILNHKRPKAKVVDPLSKLICRLDITFLIPPQICSLAIREPI
jgi:hypothetical protein